MRKALLILTIFTVIFSLSTTSLLAQGKNSPFLITGKIPHLTKLLMQQWDNSELNLSAEQKTKLLVVRKETLTGVRKLGPEIGSLEEQVVDGTLDGKTPDELSSLVDTIAILKAEATMIQLQCVYTTSEILDQQQLDFLMDLYLECCRLGSLLPEGEGAR